MTQCLTPKESTVMLTSSCFDTSTLTLPSHHCSKTTRKEETWWFCGIDLKAQVWKSWSIVENFMTKFPQKNLSLLGEQSLPEFQPLVKPSQEVHNQVAGVQLRATGQKHASREGSGLSQKPHKCVGGEFVRVGRKLGIEWLPTNYKDLISPASLSKTEVPFFWKPLSMLGLQNMLKTWLPIIFHGKYLEKLYYTWQGNMICYTTL